MSWIARAVVAVVLVGGVAVATAGIATAQTGRGHTTSAQVVTEAFRTGFGKIVVVFGTGRALYTNPNGCNSACQSIWPPLLMPVGTTTPTGAPCLGTAPHGTRLQVTYNKMRLYKFVNDIGHSVTGNGVAGFHVAKVVTGC